MHLKDCEIFLFGSYVSSPSEANDIDVLLVIPDLLEIEKLYADISNINLQNPENLIHVIIYTRDEYENSENKFSFANVKMKISFEELTSLYKICL